MEYAPQYLTRFWLDLESPFVAVLYAVYATVLILATIGMVCRLRSEPEKKWFVIFLFVALIAQSMLVCAIRTIMPPWMVYAHCLFVAALVAFGLCWFVQFWAGRVALTVCLSVTTLWTVSIYYTLCLDQLDHADIKPSPSRHGLGDIREYEDTKTTYRLARIPFHELYSLGDLLCEPVTLFGHYAFLVDYTYAVSATKKCGTTANVEIGGAPGPGRQAVLGLHRSVWQQLGMSPSRWEGSIGITSPAAIWHSGQPLRPVVPLRRNFPRILNNAVADFTVTGDTREGEAVLVAHRANRYLPFEVENVTVDGEKISPSYSDVTTVVFVAPKEDGSGRRSHWSITIRGGQDNIDVLTFETSRIP